MSLDPLTRRFDPRWLSTPIKTDGDDLFGALAADIRSGPPEPTHDPVGEHFDQALEQIVLDQCMVCPLCGAIVDRDGNVVN
jgi:hypothetical protein